MVLAAAAGLAGAAEGAARPNIVLILADDHGVGAVGCYGSRINATPGIDRIARDGMRFDNCFVPLSLCGPSRAALLTGAFAHRNGVMRNGDAFDGGQMTYPKVLQAAGYQTALVGKWHLSSTPTGVDYYGVIPGQGRFWDCPILETGHPWPAGKGAKTALAGAARKGYLTDVITDLSIEWLDRRDRSKPFCLMVHHKAPHTPHQYPESYEALFATAPPAPASFSDDWGGRDALRGTRGSFSKFTSIIDGDLRGNELGDAPILDRSDPVAFRDWAYPIFIKGYLRLVAAMDDNIARLLDHLDRAGLADSTLVVYASDNGFFLGDHGLYNKMWMYEQSMRVPLVARWPGRIAAGAVNDAMVSLLDLAPTFAAAANTAPAPEFQGRSLLPLMEGRPDPEPREVQYYHYYGQYDVPAHCGIRTATHKLICFYEEEPAARWELFDLRSDPNELVSLARRADATELLAEMKRRLTGEARRLGDPVASELEES